MYSKKVLRAFQGFSSGFRGVQEDLNFVLRASGVFQEVSGALQRLRGVSWDFSGVLGAVIEG